MHFVIICQITNGDGTTKEGFWIDAGIHAREWISPAVATYFIDRVSTAPQTYGRLLPVRCSEVLA